MKRLTPTDFINIFSSDTYIVNGGDGYNYVVTDFHLGDKNFDYGIYSRFKDGYFTSECMPDIFIDEYYEFLLNDNLENTYLIDHSIVEELRCATYDKFATILEKHGINTDKIGCISELSYIFTNELKDSSNTFAEERYAKSDNADVNKCIELYKGLYDLD